MYVSLLKKEYVLYKLFYHCFRSDLSNLIIAKTNYSKLTINDPIMKTNSVKLAILVIANHQKFCP